MQSFSVQEADQDGLNDNFRSQAGAEIGESSGNPNCQQFSSLKLLLTNIIHHHYFHEDWCAWQNHDFHNFDGRILRQFMEIMCFIIIYLKIMDFI